MGSSPLARGLLDRVFSRAPLGRIIPARAGFTKTYVSPHKTPLDHPRSRGVYARSRSTRTAWTGSSPLARGLLFLLGVGCSSHGIIPARAGFTSVAVVVISASPGSSPLARGLPTEMTFDATVGGIIPARAGFTRRPRAASAWPRDHPRSRGVYWNLLRDAPTSCGSSPLARGLRQRRQERHHDGGIIPARAGFT